MLLLDGGRNALERFALHVGPGETCASGVFDHQVRDVFTEAFGPGSAGRKPTIRNCHLLQLIARNAGSLRGLLQSLLNEALRGVILDALRKSAELRDGFDSPHGGEHVDARIPDLLRDRADHGNFFQAAFGKAGDEAAYLRVVRIGEKPEKAFLVVALFAA